MGNSWYAGEKCVQKSWKIRGVEKSLLRRWNEKKIAIVWQVAPWLQDLLLEIWDFAKLFAFAVKFQISKMFPDDGELLRLQFFYCTICTICNKIYTVECCPKKLHKSVLPTSNSILVYTMNNSVLLLCKI